jgi:hypothetical protein
MPRAHFKDAIPRGIRTTVAVIALFIAGILMVAGMLKGSLKIVTPSGWAMVVLFVVFMVFQIYADWSTRKKT